MSRPLLIEFEGAVYLITSRGNVGQPIFEADQDRVRFLDLLGREKKAASWAEVSAARVSQIQRQVEETRGLLKVFP